MPYLMKPACAVALAVLVAFIAIVGGMYVSPKESEETLCNELIKGGITLLLATGVTPFIANLWKDHEKEIAAAEQAAAEARLAASREDAGRKEMLRRATMVYYRIKSVRRMLSVFGISATNASPLSAAQAQGIHNQLVKLNAAQLQVERLKREIEFSPTELWRTQMDGRKATIVRLREIERYVRAIIKEWQIHAPSLEAGRIPTDEANEIPLLMAFVGKSDAPDGFDLAADPLHEIERTLRANWLRTSQAVAKVAAPPRALPFA